MENDILLTTDIPKKTSKRKIIIPLTIGAAVLIIAAVVIAIMINSSPSLEYTGGEYETEFEKMDDYSEMLNIYNNLWNKMSEERMNEVLEKGEIDKSYIQIANEEDATSYIATVPIENNMDYSKQDIEYISFSYIPGDGELTLSTIDDVIYHHYHDGIHEFIYESSDGEFTHYDNGLTNTYEDKTSAIDSYLMGI